MSHEAKIYLVTLLENSSRAKSYKSYGKGDEFHGAVMRALASHQGGPGSIPRVVVIYGLRLFNDDVSKRVLPILPTTSQLLCQKNFARTNDPACNAG